MKTTVLALSALVWAVCPAAELFNGKDLSGWISVEDHDVTGGYTATEQTWAVVDKGVKTPKGAVALQSEGGAAEFRSVVLDPL
jgi:hypothetical protein